MMIGNESVVHCDASDLKGKLVILAKGKVYLNTQTQREAAWSVEPAGFL